MDPIVFRFAERMLAVAIGGMAIFLGYRMFVRIPYSRDGDGKITLPWNITVVLSRVGPGVFFALFGTGVVALSLYKGLEISGKRPGSDGEVKYAAPQALSGGAAARADARALLRRDIGLLNNIANALQRDLPDYERTPIELAIPRIKFELMKPVWGEADTGWSTPTEFEKWLKNGEPDPPPPQIAQAVDYYRYARREARP